MTYVGQICPTIGVPQNGWVVCSDDNLFGSTCEFACNEHHKRIGALFSTCVQRTFGSVGWSEDVPICERNHFSIVSDNTSFYDHSALGITCPQLKELKMGETLCSNEQFVGSECKFACTAKDYQLFPLDNVAITCRNDSTWSEQMPCCESKFEYLMLLTL